MEMVIQDISLGFGLGAKSTLIYCEAIMRHNYFEILFNSVPTGKMFMDENMDWRLKSRSLNAQLLFDEIIWRVESKYA
ncbi:MAG: hypothetical protein JSU01_20840 [Bacteroidetes bacterium]|nr:hypothetical protein [Bacteroidota bacterium]